MKILVAGGTGVIGRPLIAQLRHVGYDVIGLTRSRRRARWLKEQGAIAEILDIFDAEAVHTAFRRHHPEVVVDLLNAIPRRMQDFTTEAAALDHRTRREGGANLQAAASAVGSRR